MQHRVPAPANTLHRCFKNGLPHDTATHSPRATTAAAIKQRVWSDGHEQRSGFNPAHLGDVQLLQQLRLVVAQQARKCGIALLRIRIGWNVAVPSCAHILLLFAGRAIRCINQHLQQEAARTAWCTAQLRLPAPAPAATWKLVASASTAGKMCTQGAALQAGRAVTGRGHRAGWARMGAAQLTRANYAAQPPPISNGTPNLPSNLTLQSQTPRPASGAAHLRRDTFTTVSTRSGCEVMNAARSSSVDSSVTYWEALTLLPAVSPK